MDPGGHEVGFGEKQISNNDNTSRLPQMRHVQEKRQSQLSHYVTHYIPALVWDTRARVYVPFDPNPNPNPYDSRTFAASVDAFPPRVVNTQQTHTHTHTHTQRTTHNNTHNTAQHTRVQYDLCCKRRCLPPTCSQTNEFRISCTKHHPARSN